MAGTSMIGRIARLSVDGVLVSGLNRYSQNENAPSTTEGAMEETTFEVFPGDRTTTFTMSGKFKKNDPGQDALRVAKQSGAQVTLEILVDGLSGKSGPVLLGTVTHTIDNLSGAQHVSFECLPQGDFTEIGTDFPGY